MTYFLERVLAARAVGKKLIVLGLKTATSSEIASYKEELKSEGIEFLHKRVGLKYNGVLMIYPTNEKRQLNKRKRNV